MGYLQYLLRQQPARTLRYRLMYGHDPGRAGNVPARPVDPSSPAVPIIRLVERPRNEIGGHSPPNTPGSCKTWKP